MKLALWSILTLRRGNLRWFWDIHPEKGRNAGALNLKDVVVCGYAEVVSAESESHIWEAVTLLALNSVLSVVALLGTNLLIEKLSEGGWESNEGGSSVKNDTSVVELSSRVTKRNSIEVNLPIGLASQWDLGQLSSEVILVDTTEDSFRLITLIIGVTKVEGENRLVQETLVDHTIERRNDLVDGDGIISETQNTVESAEGESKTGFLGSFSEDLVLDLEIANSHMVLGDKSAKASRAISDLKG